MQIAFGITGFDDSNLDMQHEPDYGEVKVALKKWGDEGAEFLSFHDLEKRPCSVEELGLGPLGFDDPNSLFYPI